MTIECYDGTCKKHSCNSGNPHDEGPFCYEEKCEYELMPVRDAKGCAHTDTAPMDWQDLVVLAACILAVLTVALLALMGVLP